MFLTAARKKGAEGKTGEENGMNQILLGEVHFQPYIIPGVKNSACLLSVGRLETALTRVQATYFISSELPGCS